MLQLDDSRFILNKKVSAGFIFFFKISKFYLFFEGFIPTGTTVMADTKREISWKTDPTKNEIEIELPTATQYRQKRNFSLGKNVYDDTKSTGQSKINKNNVM
jgi:hypothetical protein